MTEQITVFLFYLTYIYIGKYIYIIFYYYIIYYIYLFYPNLYGASIAERGAFP